ncbi:MAG: DNA polymerase III subunit alpha [Gammaproteobacteria bacterium]
MKNKFIHLRNSSEFSITRGLFRPNEIVDQAVKKKMPAVALTDLNNLFAAVKFVSYAETKGIKPILGAVISVQGKSEIDEILVLIQNNIGFLNLLKIISKAQENKKADLALISFSEFINFLEGLYVIIGGQRSLARRYALNNREDLLERLLIHYKNKCGDNLLLEINSIADEDSVANSIFAKKGSELAIPLVVTNDTLFANQEDFDIHDIKVCINTGKIIDDKNRSKDFKLSQFFKSAKEMYALLPEFKIALENSYFLAMKCNITFKTDKYFLPEYPVSENEDFNSFLEKKAFEGLEALLKKLDKTQHTTYKKRMNIELESIKATGFSSYFLIVADFINWSKDNNVPVGPGRGSGAGSLVAYCLGITSLDPIEHGLLFERFINPERISMPDFDIDFCMEKRDLVIDYVSQKYGRDAVSQIATFGTMAARAVVRDVARALGRPYALGDRISKMIPFVPGMTLERAIKQEPLLKEMIQNEDEVAEIIDISFKLEGIARNVGKHAGGIVIAPGKITDFCPLYIDSSSGSTMTQFDKDDLEKIGLVKFDFLGLRTLTVISKTLDAINAKKKLLNEDLLDLGTIPLDDQKVFELLQQGKTTAVFQLESPGMRELIRRLKPTKFEEITALLALYRPGPLESGMDDQFVDRKHGRENVSYAHPLLEPILAETYGVILYQEQVMQAAQVLAGYSLGQADILRRAMGKKKVEEMEEQRAVFIEGCKKNSIKEGLASKIFDLIEKFAGYGFNKSHSAAYALISYQTAFLKTYFTEQFMASVLSTELGNTDKIYTLLKECNSLGIQVKKPDIMMSKKEFFVNQDNDIEYGLGAIKGVADSFINHILENRRKHQVENLFDFTKKFDIKLGGKKSIEALAKSGAFDSLVPNRSIAMYSLNDILSESQKRSNQQFGGDLFSSNEIGFDPYEKFKNEEEIDNNEILELEREALGFYFTGHPVESLSDTLVGFTNHRIDQLTPDIKNSKIAGLIQSIRQTKDRHGQQMYFANFDDGSGSMDAVITHELIQSHHEIIKKNNILIFCGEISVDDYRSKEVGKVQYKMNVKKLYSLDGIYKSIQGVSIHITEDQLPDLKNSMEALKNLNGDIWNSGECTLEIKLRFKEKETSISLGENFRFHPNQDNITSIKQAFRNLDLRIN